MNELPKCSISVIRKARKSHKCFGCCNVINVGDKYKYTSGVWDEPESFKHCVSCASVLEGFKLMDKDLSVYEGPCLDYAGVREWLLGFVCAGWYGMDAATEVSKLFDVPLDYATSIFGDEQ